MQRCASEGLLKGGASEGEFHEITQSASEALLAGVALTGEIHLGRQCASEGILTGVGPKGEFHGNSPTKETQWTFCLISKNF